MSCILTWGYVDNHPNEEKDLNDFDISWAVDKKGNPVHLDGVDFIKVYSGINQFCGWIGETSTEVLRAQDLHIETKEVVPLDPVSLKQQYDNAILKIKGL